MTRAEIADALCAEIERRGHVWKQVHHCANGFHIRYMVNLQLTGGMPEIETLHVYGLEMLPLGLGER